MQSYSEGLAQAKLVDHSCIQFIYFEEQWKKQVAVNARELCRGRDGNFECLISYYEPTQPFHEIMHVHEPITPEDIRERILALEGLWSLRSTTPLTVSHLKLIRDTLGLSIKALQPLIKGETLLAQGIYMEMYCTQYNWSQEGLITTLEKQVI